ncbi:hypothetical protein UAY_01783 [Enterococcus moraviensis ATCC BAA-383]|uniref:Uncharacterized protein n=1 Tax=Enterococcus moraviensis ATCC BAA-383 TaxID=1158609 RepID=R2QVY2_9ENTE|nr:hypothetical protein [Enterococcus moraviensis]EOI00680.1 hypothetical protein UAY_01783 [Enterococcus moraviensis ATCC BAA-383]EOT73091.1 hypothetical protein I586_00084 [Enterococcus moraviensis ATCC BAA-383]OJG68649.1 hypothetical protein RV09_GL000048 [Enterococcus moraviensis]
MKVTVNQVFRDIHTKDVYEVGQIIEMTDERYDEIIENLGEGFIQVVEEGFPKMIKRGHYELSNGEQIEANKQEAVQAEAALSAK